MEPQAIKDWATAYIAFQQDSDKNLDHPLYLDHPLFWAAERFMIPEDPDIAEDCWAAILEILSRNPPESVIGILAAGPLEDLIDCAGPQFIDRIELQARRDPAFQHLLGGVWESSTPEIWARIEAVRGDAW
ncbi:MAG: hypothetical protein LBB55_03750 [Zoogloeaceae bacterium]|jgi:hypothetical protein|nr:hypothetical protein [Zoogloeaceae bacterium]